MRAKTQVIIKAHGHTYTFNVDLSLSEIEAVSMCQSGMEDDHRINLSQVPDRVLIDCYKQISLKRDNLRTDSTA